MGGPHRCGPELDEPLGEWSLDTEDVEQPEAYEYGLDLLWQVITNAVHEVVAGHASTVEVTLLEDGGVQVSDDGRGVPVSLQPIGMPVVEVEHHRDGYEWSQRYEFGTPGTLERGRTTTSTGTTVRCWADPAMLEAANDYDMSVLRRVQQMAFLNKGVIIKVLDHRQTNRTGEDAPPRSRTFHYPDGLVGYICDVNRTKIPIQPSIIHFAGRSHDMEIEIAMQWNAGYSKSVYTFANNVYTEDGGTHEQGFRDVLTEVVNSYVDDRIPLKTAVPELSGDDIREGLTAVISVQLANPQYADESKRKLLNREVLAFTKKLCRCRLTRWFETNPVEADTIASKAISSRLSRFAFRTSSCRG